MKLNYPYFIIVLLIVAIHSTSIAQDSTKIGLPEGAIARLGKGGINVMRFTPDGTRLVVGTDVGLWIYDVESGVETQLYTEQLGQVNVLSFSSDGKILASGGYANPIIQLWELDTGNKLSKLNLRKSNEEIHSITGLSFFTNDEGIIVLDGKGKITKWHIDTDTVELLPYNAEISNAVLVSEKPCVIVVEDRDNNLICFEVILGRQLINQTGDITIRDERWKNIRVFDYSPNNKYLATGSFKNTVLLWDITKQELSTTFKGDSALFSAIAFSHDNMTLAGGDAHGNIKLWNMENRTELLDLKNHTSGISALVFSPNGKTLASGSYDGTIRFWDYQTGKETSTFATGHIKWVKKFAFTEDDSILKCVDFNGNLFEWSLKTHQILSTQSFRQNGFRESVVFSQDAKLLALQENKCDFAFDPLSPTYRARYVGEIIPSKFNILLWDLSKDKIIDTTWNDNIGFVDALLFSHGNKIISAWIDQKGIFSWDINTGEMLFQYEILEPDKVKLTFSPDEKLLATSGRHIKSQVWDFETQQELILPKLMTALSVAFSPDGTLMAMAQPNSILLWHITPDGLDEGNSIENVSVNEDLIFSPDSRTIICSIINNFQYYIQLLDVQTGTEIGSLPAHTERITTLSFSHDGKTLASASWDGTIMLWDWEEITSKNKINRGN